MRFKTLKVSYTDYPERLNRVVAIRPETNLLDLAHALGFCLEIEFEHLFEFVDANKHYQVNPNHADDIFTPSLELIDIKTKKLEDMSNKFVFAYDFGDNYEFSCERLEDTEIELEEDDNLDPLIMVCLSGKGAGIFEDNKYELDQYLEGNINPKKICEDDAWNLMIRKYEDFDRDIIPEIYTLHVSEIEDIDYMDEPKYDGLGSYINDDEYFDDEDDGEIDPEVLNSFLRDQAASDIFNDPEINKKYRQLILKYDINYAYEMIANCLIRANEEVDDDKILSDDIDNLYLEYVEDLD